MLVQKEIINRLVLTMSQQARHSGLSHNQAPLWYLLPTKILSCHMYVYMHVPSFQILLFI
jgi:hypothetical protein